jgi:hypothetical protein
MRAATTIILHAHSVKKMFKQITHHDVVTSARWLLAQALHRLAHRAAVLCTAEGLS